MNRLPQQLTFPQLQTKWAAIINPLLASPIANGLLLTGAALVPGVNTINHKLGRKLQGWVIVGLDNAAVIYDNQSTNQMPELTLVLNCDTFVNINLWIF